MIQGIQDRTRTAIASMKSGTGTVEQGVITTNQAGEALERIIGMAERVDRMIAQIAIAASQQAAAARSVQRQPRCHPLPQPRQSHRNGHHHHRNRISPQHCHDTRAAGRKLHLETRARRPSASLRLNQPATPRYATCMSGKTKRVRIMRTSWFQLQALKDLEIIP